MIDEEINFVTNCGIIKSLYKELDAVKRQRDELLDWQKQAMSVIPDYQTIGHELDIPIGTSVCEALLPAIRKLICQRNEAQENLRITQNALAEAKTERDEAQKTFIERAYWDYDPNYWAHLRSIAVLGGKSETRGGQQMSDQPTPQTDSEWEQQCCSEFAWYRIAENMKEASRHKERERDEAREQNSKLTEALKEIQWCNNSDWQQERAAKALATVEPQQPTS